MTREALDPTIHVALSSLEPSALGIVAFDPDTLPAIRGGRRINTIDADDSGTLRYAVPLVAWPDALWRALADTILGHDDAKGPAVDLPILYASRPIPDPADRSLLVSLAPVELVEGLRATHPDAFNRKDRIAARIRYLEEPAWSHHPIALLDMDALSLAGWKAAACAMPDPDPRWRWSPALRQAARSTRNDEAARVRRARMRLVELHAALHLACQIVSDGLDVDGYLEDLIAGVLGDPIALAMLREQETNEDDDLAIVRIRLDEGGHRWRGSASRIAADDAPSPLAA